MPPAGSKPPQTQAVLAEHAQPHPHPEPSLARWVLAVIGIMCVGLGGIGAVVPGMPTTVFLIMACWCFARSCPWLETRLVRNRFFRPFLIGLDPGTTMPRRARIVTSGVIATSVAVSSGVLLVGGAAVWIPAVVVAAGGVGVWSVWKLVP